MLSIQRAHFFLNRLVIRPTYYPQKIKRESLSLFPKSFKHFQVVTKNAARNLPSGRGSRNNVLYYRRHITEERFKDVIKSVNSRGRAKTIQVANTS